MLSPSETGEIAGDAILAHAWKNKTGFAQDLETKMPGKAGH
jgi:hypothetical protein